MTESGWMNIADLAPEQPEKRLHTERYEYAASALRGLRVLDCACGMGYGTAILAQTCYARGVDIDPEAVGTARLRYPCHPFSVADMYDVDFSGVDALVSFETLEHLEFPERVIARLPNTVKHIVASVPIRPTVGWNPWHKSDHTVESFSKLIGDCFRIVHRLDQIWVDGRPLYLMLHGSK